MSPSNDKDVLTDRDERVGPTRGLNRMARHVAMRLLAHLKEGEIALVDQAGETRFGVPDVKEPLRATVTICDPRFYRKVLFGGSIGAAEAYMDGYWTCSDLTALIRIFVRNRRMMERMEKGWARLTYPINKTLHLLRSNTRQGSRRNIAAHYDLSNDFFKQFLDETMTYSCAIFEHEDATIEEASVAKLDRVCRKMRLTPDDHILEIGTGWGSFAIHAATHYRCRVTTTTISQKQFELAQERAKASGVAGRIEFLLEDYRELKGDYTKIASIEMIEAVGWEYVERFLRKCSNLLAPDGMMVLQTITMGDQEYEQSKRDVDFVKRYIFPGGCVPSVTAMVNALTRATDMRLVHLEDITRHYAKTLRMWRERFYANLDQVRSLGFDERFLRMWEFYLAYCEGAFMERFIGDVQMTLVKPEWRGKAILGSLTPRPSA